jgi:transposase
MARFHKILVDIPDDKGVHTKSAGAKGEKYVYKYVKFFRNANGEPRNKAKAIGKLDPLSGRMYPNGYYFEIYNLEPALQDISIWDYGYSYLVLKVCRDTGLLDCLDQAFGQKAMDIVAMAAYIIREGNAMDGIDDWLLRNYFPGYSRLLSSQSTSKIAASLTPRQRDAFFTNWVKKALGEGTVCYDVTSISSYSQQMPDVERGYNRDGEGLPQFNLGMFCHEMTRTPLYYNRYNGSLTDKTNLCYVLANAKAVGIKRVKMVLDGGFWSEECLTNLNNACEAFTMGMPLYLKESERILAAYGGGIEKYANELTERHVYCVPAPMELYGFPGRALIYYDSWNHLAQCDDLSDHINRLKAELETIKRYPKSKLSRYTPYFVLTKHEQDSGFDYYVDEKKIEKMRKLKGYFLIFSTDMESTPQEILEHYRAKDADEKLFAQIKVEMRGNRIRTHNEETTEGKTFVTFIACIIRSYLMNRLSKYVNDHSSSMKKIFNQLSNITILSSNDCYRLTKALTKTQKSILSIFDAADDIVASIKKVCIR